MAQPEPCTFSLPSNLFVTPAGLAVKSTLNVYTTDRDDLLELRQFITTQGMITPSVGEKAASAISRVANQISALHQPHLERMLLVVPNVESLLCDRKVGLPGCHYSYGRRTFPSPAACPS